MFDLANCIGEPQHRAKWIGKLTRYGFSARQAERLYASALAEYADWGSFAACIVALAGCENGIQTAPAPGAAWNR